MIKAVLHQAKEDKYRAEVPPTPSCDAGEETLPGRYPLPLSGARGMKILAAILVCVILPAACPRDLESALGPAILRRDITSHLANAGWGYDRYPNLHPLAPHGTQVIADLRGPGVIHQIHITRMRAQDDVVLEIRFDDAAQPAVRCPLVAFFGRGPLSTKWIENGPGAWNCFFPMPFKKHAEVMLRNDGGKRIVFYSFVQWEKLPRWDRRLGWFHATGLRKIFQLTQDTDEVMFQTTGAGQFIGRAWRVTTDEPSFNGWNHLMEGNNEVDIDGVPRVLDYLGSEDSFNFSWGFQGTWLGRHSGITENTRGKLAMYRFHDVMPLRFKKSFRWTLDFRYEHFGPDMNTAAARKANSHWVNYDMVFYWYQDSPGGYVHAPLLPLAERKQEMIHPGPNKKEN